MAMGLIYGALGGLGQGAEQAGAQLDEFAGREQLLKEQAQIQALRDQRLNEMHNADMQKQFAHEDVTQQRGIEAQKQLQAQSETFQHGENVAQRGLTQQQIDVEKQRAALEAQQVALAAKQTNLALQTGQITLEQAKRVQGLYDAYQNESDPTKRQQIATDIATFTGKGIGRFRAITGIDPTTMMPKVVGVIDTLQGTVNAPGGTLGAGGAAPKIVDPFQKTGAPAPAPQPGAAPVTAAGPAPQPPAPASAPSATPAPSATATPSAAMPNDFAARQQMALKRVSDIQNDPDLNNILAQRDAAVRSGNAVQATNLTNQYQALLAQRYPTPQ